MKLLFITADHYPYFGPASNLMRLLFRFGFQNKEEIHVLTVKNSYFEADEETSDGVIIHRAPVWSAYSEQEWELIKSISQEEYIAGKEQQERERKAIRAVQGETLHTGIAYMLGEKLKEFPEGSFDAVIPVPGLIDTMECALQYQQEHTNTRVFIWQVDPCASLRTATETEHKRNVLFERNCFQKANGIFSAPVLYQEHQTHQPVEILEKIYSIEFPNIVPELFHGKGKKIKEKRILCLYCGMLVRNQREPDYAMRVFSALPDNSTAELQFLGALYGVTINTAERIKYAGRSALSENKEELLDADCLVNISSRAEDMVPSKLFDYISTGKPIISFSKTAKDPVINYLKKYPLSLVIVENEKPLSEQAAEVDAFLQASCGKRVPEEQILSEYAKCTPRYCAELMTENIRKAMQI